MNRIHDEEVKVSGCIVCSKLTLDNPAWIPDGLEMKDGQWTYIHDECKSVTLKEMQKTAACSHDLAMVELGHLAAAFDNDTYKRN